MKVINQYLEESLLFNREDFIYKFDDWKSGKSKILLVLGYAGGGKSTTGKEIAKKYKADYFSTDDEPIRNLKTLWKDLNNKYEEDKAIEKWEKDAHIVVLKHFKTITKPAVWEGVHLYFWLSPREISGFPTIIKGTSHIVSTIRAIKRNLKRNEDNEKNIPWYKLILWTIADNINLRKKYNQVLKYLKSKV